MTGDEVQAELKAIAHRTLRTVEGRPIAEAAERLATAFAEHPDVATVLYGEPVDFDPVDALVVARGSAPLGGKGRRYATLALYVDGSESCRIEALLPDPKVGQSYKLTLRRKD